MRKPVWSITFLCLAILIPATAHAQHKPQATVGAYYFDGWSGKTNHVTKLLATEYADRKPVWGWKADTVEIMQKQIDYCADHSLAFWAFDWYYPEGKDKTTPLNNALDLYLKAPNSQRLKFCLLVANHEGFRIGPKDWDACCDKWMELFLKPTHLRLDGQPFLIFFSPDELHKAFGGVEGVRKAFDSLRAKAKKVGLPGVSIAACTGPGTHLADLARSGYTLLTGYNYNGGWLNGGGSQPFKKLIDDNERIFDQFAKETPLPYVPVITAGWDRRPWEQGELPPEKMSVWYPDRTPKLVEEFVRRGVQWLDKHPNKATPQRLLLIYAWNENGEGGYLTPTAKDGTEYLKAVERAVMPSACEAGFISLFDGKTLDGWTICCLDKDRELGAKAWTIDRGTILANTVGHKEQFYIWLTSNKEYGDFVLRLRFQCERGPKGNSGVQIRSRYIAATGWMEGPQIDIDPPNPRGTTGKLWNEGPGEHRWLSNEPIPGLKFFYADQGDGWNDMEITAKGMRIKSVLNGVTVVDYDGSGVLDDQLHRQHGVGTRGVIGLQIHQHDEVKLRFKDIWIKEL